MSTLLAAGREVHPTFRTPHVTIAFSELDVGLASQENLEHERRPNPHYEP